MLFSRSLIRLAVFIALLPTMLMQAAKAHDAPTPPVAPQASTAPAKPHFDVLEYQIDGNSTLDTPSIERAVYPFLGSDKTIDDVEAARTALEKKYRDSGYGTVSVSIPVQTVASGVVLLQVLEGRVEKLQVVGARYYSQGRILDNVPSLAEGQVPYFPKVKEQLASVNTSADEKVTPLLRPGLTPGTTDVDLEVEDHLPLHGSLTLDNNYTPLTSAARLTGSIEYDNLFQAQQHVSLLYQMSPQDLSQVKLWSASYTIPLAGQILALSLVRSDSASIAGLGGVDVFGRGKIIGLHDIIPLPQDNTTSTPGHTLSQVFNIGIDYKDFEQNVEVNENPNAGFATPIRYAPLSASFSSTLYVDKGEWDFGAGLEVALRNFGSSASDFDAKRYQALGNFAILKMDFARIQPLPESLSLYTRLDLQFADQPLVSNEQMVVGGVDSVRGYLSASETGDSGARGTIELRSPNLAGPWSMAVTDFSLHSFVDAAYVRIFSPLPAQTPSYVLASTGVGLRVKQTDVTSFALDVGFPMRSSQYAKAWSPRIQASASVAF